MLVVFTILYKEPHNGGCILFAKLTYFIEITLLYAYFFRAHPQNNSERRVYEEDFPHISAHLKKKCVSLHPIFTNRFRIYII